MISNAHLKSFLASKSQSFRPGCPSTGCPRRVRMGPVGEDCHRRATDRGTPPAPRRGTLRACRVPQAGSVCQVLAACCSWVLLVHPDRPGALGVRWDHPESVPSSSVAPGPPGWRCFGDGRTARRYRTLLVFTRFAPAESLS